MQWDAAAEGPQERSCNDFTFLGIWRVFLHAFVATSVDLEGGGGVKRNIPPNTLECKYSSFSPKCHDT